ncbi:MAG: exodeoxyribonuclease VII large subunit, partial [Planctomycetes bacterium]|nr:exodeoxyribonuclease VII large subunit [Planctomycetota bacterium]
MEPRRRALFGYEPPRSTPPGDVPSVSKLVNRARQSVERDFARVLVKGEVSNLVQAGSGHIYFTLKDDKAQLAAVMWRASAARLSFALEQGSSVVAEGRLTIYEARGSFQLVVDRLEQEGLGALEARFRALEKQYREAGWFDEQHKKPLPFLPTRIGIVTSASGAALHDILQTLHGRHPRARVLLAPTRVQGQGAAEEIAEALQRLDDSDLVDVVIVGRGGGSLEDLWAFNEPVVVEAIHRARVPVISAVGHEVDVTLADLVADRRALTPTAAGECVVPVLADLEANLDGHARRMRRELESRLEQTRLRLSSAGQSWALREPKELVHRARRRLDELGRALPRSLRVLTERRRNELERLGKAPALIS